MKELPCVILSGMGMQAMKLVREKTGTQLILTRGVAHVDHEI